VREREQRGEGRRARALGRGAERRGGRGRAGEGRLDEPTREKPQEENRSQGGEELKRENWKTGKAEKE